MSGNDFMQYWIDDDATDAVGLYLESMGNPRKFSRIARNLALIKPVIVVKSGVSAFGVPPGHRVRRTKARPEVFSAMLKQAGVIRVENVHQLFDVAQLVVHQPLPAGDRVAVVGNSDRARHAHRRRLHQLGARRSPTARSRCPARRRPSSSARRSTRRSRTREVDSVLTCFIPPLVTGDEDVAAAVRDAAAAADKPIAATFLGMRGVDDGHATVSGTGGATRAIPVYAMPEDAVRALAAATRYGQWRAKDQGTPVAPAGINRRIAEDVVHTVLVGRPRRAGASTRTRPSALLQAYGIDVWANHDVRTRPTRRSPRRRAGRLPRGAQVDGADDAPPGRRGRRAGRPAHRGRAARRVGLAHRPAGPARRRPARRAADGDPRASRAS